MDSDPALYGPCAASTGRTYESKSSTVVSGGASKLVVIDLVRGRGSSDGAIGIVAKKAFATFYCIPISRFAKCSSKKTMSIVTDAL